MHGLFRPEAHIAIILRVDGIENYMSGKKDDLKKMLHQEHRLSGENALGHLLSEICLQGAAFLLAKHRETPSAELGMCDRRAQQDANEFIIGPRAADRIKHPDDMLLGVIGEHPFNWQIGVKQAAQPPRMNADCGLQALREQLCLVSEQMVDCGLADTGGQRNLVQIGAGEAAIEELLGRSVQDPNRLLR